MKRRAAVVRPYQLVGISWLLYLMLPYTFGSDNGVWNGIEDGISVISGPNTKNSTAIENGPTVSLHQQSQYYPQESSQAYPHDQRYPQDFGKNSPDAHYPYDSKHHSPDTYYPQDSGHNYAIPYYPHDERQDSHYPQGSQYTYYPESHPDSQGLSRGHRATEDRQHAPIPSKSDSSYGIDSTRPKKKTHKGSDQKEVIKVDGVHEVIEHVDVVDPEAATTKESTNVLEPTQLQIKISDKKVTGEYKTWQGPDIEHQTHMGRSNDHDDHYDPEPGYFPHRHMNLFLIISRIIIIEHIDIDNGTYNLNIISLTFFNFSKRLGGDSCGFASKTH